MSEKAQRLLQELVKMPHPIIQGTVTAVNLGELTCDVDPDDEGAEIPDVRLRAEAEEGEGNGFIIIPAVGSKVTVVMLDKNTGVLLQARTAQLLTLATENESLKKLLQDTYAAIGRMVFTTNQGPTIKLVNAAEFTALSQRLDLLLKD